jgi:hypothetical protein
MNSSAPQSIDIAVLVFARGADTAFCEVAKTETARILAQGFVYCGYIAIDDGEPRVKCAPGDDAAAFMLRAGYHFAEWLGSRLKELQLEQQRRDGGSEQEEV